MYLSDYSIALVLMEAKLLEAEAERRERRENPVGASSRQTLAGPFAPVFRSAPHPGEGGI